MTLPTLACLALGLVVACAKAPHPGDGVDAADGDDTADAREGSTVDAVVTIDATEGAPADAANAGPDAAPDAPLGILSGGPCMSGAPGLTAYRVRWVDGGGTAVVSYEVNGLPDPQDHTGVYGYTIGYVPQFVDPFLGDGGVLLDSSDFIDIELSTAGVSSISAARLSIYGRSFHTTTSGSFHWQTFVGIGAAPTNLVSNVAPYAWYGADMTSELAPNDAGTLIRIKAGPSSGVLVVNRVELCMQAS
jgi:hypothetical protein